MRFLKEFSSYNIAFIITILGIKLYEITNLLYVINIKQIRSLKPFCCIINATMIKKEIQWCSSVQEREPVNYRHVHMFYTFSFSSTDSGGNCAMLYTIGVIKVSFSTG